MHIIIRSAPNIRVLAEPPFRQRRVRAVRAPMPETRRDQPTHQRVRSRAPEPQHVVRGPLPRGG